MNLSATRFTSNKLQLTRTSDHLQQRHATLNRPQQQRLRTTSLRTVAAMPGDDDFEEKPDWYLDLLENAKDDPELAQLLASAGDDPSNVESRLRSEMDTLHARITGKFGSGEEAPPEITFRSQDPFELWVWVELYSPPSASELEMTQEVINSWFMLGRLGAYNSSNLQVLYSSNGAGNELEYDVNEATSSGLVSSMHDMGTLETNGPWVRFWCDLGTSDELALDILMNALISFSREHVGIRQVLVGGQNEDWPVPEKDSLRPEVTMDPMRFV